MNQIRLVSESYESLELGKLIMNLICYELGVIEFSNGFGYDRED
jgi:hypothetical protein